MLIVHKLFIRYQIWCHCNSILIDLYDIFNFIFHYIEMFSVFSIMAVVKKSDYTELDGTMYHLHAI